MIKLVIARSFQGFCFWFDDVKDEYEGIRPQYFNDVSQMQGLRYGEVLFLGYPAFATEADKAQIDEYLHMLSTTS